MAIAMLYEHPEWFRPLFETLDRHGVEYTPVDAASLRWDPALALPYPRARVINEASQASAAASPSTSLRR